MAKGQGQGNAGGWPSTTGQPSGMALVERLAAAGSPYGIALRCPLYLLPTPPAATRLTSRASASMRAQRNTKAASLHWNDCARRQRDIIGECDNALPRPVIWCAEMVGAVDYDGREVRIVKVGRKRIAVHANCHDSGLSNVRRLVEGESGVIATFEVDAVGEAG